MITATLLAALALAAGAPTSCVDAPTWQARYGFSPVLAQAEGVYVVAERRVDVTLENCERIAIARDGRLPRSHRHLLQLASAVFVVAHEAQHVAGVVLEPVADCRASRSFLRVAARLGIGPGRRALLANYVPTWRFCK